jgi:hypothetical protein
VESWPNGLIDAECRSSYRIYAKRLIEHYSAYYVRYPKLRCARHPYSACSVGAALPNGFAALQQLLPPKSVHIHARSARSSQSLALGLLGAAAHRDPSLIWFWSALGLAHEVSEATYYRFERTLDSADLNERPRVSQIDFTAETSRYFAAVECKWSEPGFGTCSCEREREGSPEPGAFCAERVRVRNKYWLTAQDVFGLRDERLPLFGCPISASYQAVRTAAAVRHLAGTRRQAVFVLLFDSNNPYFRRTGDWPGWPGLLEETVAAYNVCHRFVFKAISWQDLIRRLPLSSQVRKWAAEKHQLA